MPASLTTHDQNMTSNFGKVAIMKNASFSASNGLFYAQVYHPFFLSTAALALFCDVWAGDRYTRPLPVSPLLFSSSRRPNHLRNRGNRVDRDPSIFVLLLSVVIVATHGGQTE